jgi:predicted secreted protein
MATLTGNNGAISIGGIAVLAVRNFTIDMTSDTIETTTMSAASDARTYVKGLSSFSGSADVYFDESDYDTNETTFNPTSGLVGAQGVAGKFYIDYAAAGNDDVFQGSIIVTGYSVNTSMDGMVEGSISFQGTGTLAYSSGSSVAYP